MKTFDFYVDTKVTTWYRTKFEIECETEEEAEKLAIEFHNQGNTSSIGWDEIDDTQENMRVKDNDGEPTEELFNQSGNCIWDNTKTN
jgi:hypothetical protein